MDSEKQLLDIISEKEEVLRRDTETVSGQAEEILLKSRQKASLILELAEKEGQATASEYFNREMEKLRTDICEVRNSGVQEAEQIRVRGSSRLPRAVSKIISLVTG